MEKLLITESEASKLLSVSLQTLRNDRALFPWVQVR